MWRIRFFTSQEDPIGELSKKYLTPQRIQIRDARAAQGNLPGLECEPDPLAKSEFNPMDSCLHPHRSAVGGMTLTRFHDQQANNEPFIIDAEFDGTQDPFDTRRQRAYIEFHNFEVQYKINDEAAHLINPAGTDLGQMLLGDQKETSFVVENVGFGFITISNISLTGPHASDFQIIGTSRGSAPFIIGMGGEFKIDVRATASTNPEPLRRVGLKVEGNQGQSGKPLIPVQAVIAYTPVTQYVPELRVWPQELHFSITLGNATKVKTITLFDRSGGQGAQYSSARLLNLDLSQPQTLIFTGPDAQYFTLGAWSKLHYPYMSVTIVYNPPSGAAQGKLIEHHAELEIHSNSIDNDSSQGGIARVQLLMSSFFTIHR